MAGSSTGSGQPRQAAPADLPAIRRLIRGAYARYADRMDRLPAPVLHDYSAEADAGQIWIVGEPVVGVIVLIREQNGLLIDNVAVDPSAQGAGLGRGLMEFAEERARLHGLRRLRLYTNEVMTENLGIYSRLGYHEVSRSTQEGYRRVFMEKVIDA
jgi:GNAT superfamily N-acetyltransferase